METELTHQKPVAETQYESTRSTRTISNYRYRFNRIHRDTLLRLNFYGVSHEERHGCLAEVKDIVDQLEIFAQTASISNFQTYRSAVLFHLVESTQNGGEAVLRKIQPEIDRAKRITPFREKRTGKRDEISYMRRIISRDLKKLRAKLQLYAGYRQYGIWADDWIMATMATGLRPNEWENAKLIRLDSIDGSTNNYELQCRNSKRKRYIPPFVDLARVNAENPGSAIESVFDMEVQGLARTEVKRPSHRRIPIKDEDVPVVERHLANLQSNIQSGIHFTKSYEWCRKLLFRTCQEIFGGKKNYTLYSFRHQFAANGKTKYSREELAQIMGHDAVKSAENSYAAKRFADKGHLEAQRTNRRQKQKQAASQGQSGTWRSPT